MGVLLGIDFGDRRIGLAVSDSQKKLARRLMTFENSPKSMKEIGEITKNKNVEKIIVGMPLAARGETEQTRKTQKFIADLRDGIKIPIETMNEIMTSKIAEKNLEQSKVRDRKKIIDQEAARIILQDYINYNSDSCEK